MSSKKVIENRISLLRKYLKIVKGFQKYSRKEIETNLLIRGALERYLYLLIQSTIDLAEAIIAYKRFRKPTTFSEAFSILNEEKILPAPLTEKLTQMVGFRNIVAHDYESIDYDIVYTILHHRLSDIQAFLKKIQ